jgi:hypothetical protein
LRYIPPKANREDRISFQQIPLSPMKWRNLILTLLQDFSPLPLAAARLPRSGQVRLDPH